MQNTKLNLDFDMVDKSRHLAIKIAEDVQSYVKDHSTVSVERTICRLLGIDGVDSFGVPLPNVLIDFIKERGNINIGVARYIGNAMLHYKITPNEVAIRVANDSFDITKLEWFDDFQIFNIMNTLAKETLTKIKENRNTREAMLQKYGDKDSPFLYLIVASGNIYEDVIQAVAAARQGADVIAVIRTTGQSLLDYVPYGATTDGFGGTAATQENFKIMRSALDSAGEELGRYIRLCNYCSGLCMPEIAAMGAIERLDMMLNDALYGILFRDINMKRTLIDQYFARMINAFAGVIINTGEDNYLTTSDAIEEAHTVLTSQFINEQLAILAGLPEEQMGLGHAFEIDPDITNGFLFELSQAQMVREIFPKAPLKYMPPTKFMTGDIFKGHVQNSLFNMVTIMTNQKIHLLGMLTEAIHTPLMSDRALSIENAKYIFNTMQDISEEITFKQDGIIVNRANEVLSMAYSLLKKIEEIGMFKSLELGIFANIKRRQDGGKGLDGVFSKDEKLYFNPFIDLLAK